MLDNDDVLMGSAVISLIKQKCIWVMVGARDWLTAKDGEWDWVSTVTSYETQEQGEKDLGFSGTCACENIVEQKK